MNKDRLLCPFCSFRAPVNTIILADLGRPGPSFRWASLDITCAQCKNQYCITLDCKNGEIFISFVPGTKRPARKR